MKTNRLVFPLLLSFTCSVGMAQVSTDSASTSSQMNISDNGSSETRQIYKRKGNLCFSWGYNRAFYGNSDIHFTGTNYDFTIYDVTASDESHYDFLTYIKPNTLTVPQWNERFGYFLNDKTFLSFGHEHMKYVLDKQATLLTGTISSGINAGTYNNTEVLIVDEGETGSYQPAYIDSLQGGFIEEYEHCDGLNDFNFEFGRLEQLWISKNSKHALSFQATVNTGFMILDTDAEILGLEARHNNMPAKKKSFHLAGYSFSASAGVQFDFFRHFFVLGKLKAGYINVPDIRTTLEGGRADQHFKYIEPMIMVGYSHPICRH